MKQQENIQPPSTDTNSLILQPKLVLRGISAAFSGKLIHRTVAKS